jgi:transcriptional regulator with XRE-family HTH domain
MSNNIVPMTRMTDDDLFDRETGGRVRQMRIYRKLSQTVLGQAIGVSCQQVQKYENGVNRISCSALRRMAGALDCRMGLLLGEAAPRTPQDSDLARDIIHALKVHGHG